MSEARQIEAEAADWLLKRDNSSWSEKDQEALDEWLGQALAHKAAFWRLEEGWKRADRIASLGLPSQYGENLQQRFRDSWKPLALAASLALAAFVGFSQLGDFGADDQPRGQRIATSVGGHKLVELGDGSRIELNTATSVTASVTSKAREVWLEQGEAFFDVHHSKKVPFIVHAGPKTVTVLGTKFSVRRDGEKVTVAVLSGRVRVTEAKASDTSGTMQVAAGSIAITEPSAAIVTENAPTTVQAELAWRDGQLIFRNDTLAEAAAEFNRYNDKKLQVVGKAAELKIGGSFKASNVEGFARLLRDAYGLEISQQDDQIRVSE